MKNPAILPLLIASCLWAGPAGAHALLERTQPGANATLKQAPEAVVIYFDAELEPVFSKLIVKNAQGAKVSAGNGEIVPGNRRALATRLSATQKGAYHVYWNVVSHDGHRAQGDYIFTVQ